MDQIYQVENTIPALLSFCLQSIDEQKYSHALEAALAALKIDPNHPEAHHLAYHAYAGLGEADIARMMLERAIKLQPNNPQYHYNAAVNSHTEGNTHRAMAHYAQALRIDPNMADALWNYGEHLRLDEHFELALNCFERLIQLGRTDYKALWDRMAVCYSSLKRFKETDAMYQRALADGDSGMLTHWEYALYRLSLDDFETGFKYYNNRFKCNGRNSVYCHDFPYPLWDGHFSNNQTLLIHGEQGLGDELMFASVFNELFDDADSAAAQIIIACKPGLARLFAENFPRAQIRTHLVGDRPANVSDLKIDAQLPMGHLLSMYRHTLKDFDAHRRPYFKASNERVEYYNQRIKELGREAQDGKRRFRVGLMWGSNPAAISTKFSRWTEQRSVPLALFSPFADLLDDVEFISLQNHERGAEVAFAPKLEIIDFSLDQADFYDTAALAKNLDLVITVCTSVSHLVGGMGLETWVPLMKRADWRHGQSRMKSIWYDGTRYFRQNTANDWRDVMADMHQALGNRVEQWKKNNEQASNHH